MSQKKESKKSIGQFDHSRSNQKKIINKMGGSQKDGSTGGAGNTNTGPVGT